jgi:hypothetical protein
VGAVTTKVLLDQLPNLITDTGFELIRYNPNGSIDTSFGHHRAVITDFSSVAPFTSPSDLVIEPNGDMIVVGQVAQANVSISLPRPVALRARTLYQQWTTGSDIWFGR